MRHVWTLGLFCALLICSCENSDKWIALDTHDTLSFEGLFATAAYYGPIELNIKNGQFECLSFGVNGRSAGKVVAYNTVIDFVDTLVFATHVIYGPIFVLVGRYNYLYDGNNLKIQRNINGGVIKYELFAKKAN